MSTRVSDFSIEVPAKWILTGEHTVLRGGESLAFVMPRFLLRLSYRNQGPISFNPNPFQSQIRSLLARAREYLGVREDVFSTGEISISSDIPIGAGLGSSAALCVAIARLAIWRSGADLSRWIPLATHLEDVFHGKSSGMDVNAIAIGKPILFSMVEGARPLPGLHAMPRFEFYDSGIRGSTRDCIERVKHWQRNHAHLKDALDEQMKEATRVARVGLELFQGDPARGEARLREAMELAQGCIETWGLVTPELLGQKYDLLKQGALAVKLTGAGLGGFWIALWPSSEGGLDR
jgi:mevalonate kinase